MPVAAREIHLYLQLFIYDQLLCNRIVLERRHAQNNIVDSPDLGRFRQHHRIGGIKSVLIINGRVLLINRRRVVVFKRNRRSRRDIDILDNFSPG